MSDPQDVPQRVFAKLTVLSNNLPPSPDVNDVRPNHALVDQLKGLGYAVDNFRFDSERDYYDVEGEVIARVHSHVFKTKVDALLLYFRLDQEQTKIGFDAPRVH